MSTLAEIEEAAKALPQDQQEHLLKWLSRLMATKVHALKATETRSILDIPPVSVGKILKPLSSDDDILGELLEDRV